MAVFRNLKSYLLTTPRPMFGGRRIFFDRVLIADVPGADFFVWSKCLDAIDITCRFAGLVILQPEA